MCDGNFWPIGVDMTFLEFLMKWGTTFLILICLNGCTSSGVAQIGPDTYTIATSSEISPAWAKKSALKDAEKYCQSQGKYIMPFQSRTGSHVDSVGDNIATYDFTFRCLAANDPDLTRPELRDPTTNINVDENVRILDETANRGVDDSSDLYTELQKLDQLRKDGILTEEEFQQQKKKVLEKH